MSSYNPSNDKGDGNLAGKPVGTDVASAAGSASAPPSEEHVSNNRQNPPVEDGDEDYSQDEDKDFDDEDDYLSDEEDYNRRVQDIPDEEKTPVSVVTGFLGAGKTTLVNYILREQREMKIAVIENEYGAVSIDTALVQENVRETEDIVTMDNGCVCCTVRGDLVKTLIDFLPRRHTFDCILLETTGIADPSPILATFNQDLDVRSSYRIDSVLCLVDAKNITTQLSREPEDGAVNEAVQQLAFADTVIVNKTDLVDETQLKSVLAKVKSVNAFARVVQSQKSRVPLSSVLNLNSYNLDRTLELLEQEKKEEEARKKAAEEKAAREKANGGHGHSHNHEHKEHAHDHKDDEHKNGHGNGHSHGNSHAGHSHDREGKCIPNSGDKRKREGDGDGDESAPKKPREAVEITATRHDSQVGSLGMTIKGSLDVDRFNKFMAHFLNNHSEDLFRSKGVLSFANMSKKYVFQGVHEQINCDSSPLEWAKDGSDRESQMVFIGLNLDKDMIAAGLKSCIAKDDAPKEES